MTTISPRRVRQIMGDAIRELHDQALRARGEHAAIHTLNTARAWQSGPRSGLGATGPRSSDVSDPTGNNVVRLHDPGDRYAKDLTAAWYALDRAVKNLHDVTAGIHARADKVNRRTVSLVRECANPYCDAEVIIGSNEGQRAGRCDPCATYREQHPDSRDAPKETVDARRRKREQRDRERIM